MRLPLRHPQPLPILLNLLNNIRIPIVTLEPLHPALLLLSHRRPVRLLLVPGGAPDAFLAAGCFEGGVRRMLGRYTCLNQPIIHFQSCRFLPNLRLPLAPLQIGGLYQSHRLLLPRSPRRTLRAPPHLQVRIAIALATPPRLGRPPTLRRHCPLAPPRSTTLPPLPSVHPDAWMILLLGSVVPRIF